LEEPLLESFGEGRILAERTGSGPVSVIGLHGWARTREDLAGPLAGLNALAVDLPGFGLSPEPPTIWGSEEYAAMVAEVAGGLNRPQVLLGHSFGGRVAVKLAARWPELVSGIVLTGVPLVRRQSPGARPALPFQMARWGRHHGLMSEARMEMFRQRYGSTDYRRARGIMRSILVRVVNESYEDDLARITCSVELVWGSNDTVVPLQVARDACALIGAARLQVIEGSGHMTPLSAPDELRHSVCRLLHAGTR
jgi:pimeloyl-ACP methyl ester carboxylesterase